MLLPLLRRWLNPRPRVSTFQRREAVQQQRYRPFLQLLEGRTLPSTFLVTNVLDHGAGSLRAAMLKVNHDTVNQVDVIDFKIAGTGVQTINLLSELPVLTHPVNVDGTSQPGYAGSPLIALNGAGIAGGGDGMVLDARSYAHAFTGEIQGLKFSGFNDGIRVVDSSSSTSVSAQLLNNVVSLTSGGDGVQVLAGTGSTSAQISNNKITVGKAGDGIVLATAGTSTTYTVSTNTLTANGGGDGIFTNGAGSSNSLSYSGNTVKTSGGGDALALFVSSASPTSVSVVNNVLSTNNQATGLILSGGSHFQALVQGNTLSSDLRGVRVIGSGGTAGVVDLGGGSLGSTGGNDFSSFKTATANSYAIGLFSVNASYTMTALDNVFSVPPASVIADGNHDRAAGGSGSILV
jgi:hypothetical protein